MSERVSSEPGQVRFWEDGEDMGLMSRATADRLRDYIAEQYPEAEIKIEEAGEDAPEFLSVEQLREHPFHRSADA